MIGTLQEHADGKLYIVTSDYDSQEPIEIRAWWPLGMKSYEYKRSYGADRIGQKMYQGNIPGKYLGEDGLILQPRAHGPDLLHLHRKNPRPHSQDALRGKMAVWLLGEKNG